MNQVLYFLFVILFSPLLIAGFILRTFVEKIAFHHREIAYRTDAEFVMHTDEGLIYRRATPGECEFSPDQKVIVFFHGNGCNLLVIGDDMQKLADATGCAVVAFEYHGYGPARSSTVVVNSFIALFAHRSHVIRKEAEHMISFLERRFKVPTENIYLLGHSVGSGIAVQCALQKPNLGGVILVSPYLSLISVVDRALAKICFWGDMLRTVESIGSLNKLLIVHGTADEVIPYSHGLELSEMARARLVTLQHALHNDSFDPPYFSLWMPALRRFIEE